MKNEFMEFNLNDFGFSSMDENQVRAGERQLQESLQKTQTMAKSKIEGVMAMIMPLVDGLIKDSNDKPYIYWPNRKEKLETFKQSLLDYVNS